MAGVRHRRGFVRDGLFVAHVDDFVLPGDFQQLPVLQAWRDEATWHATEG